MQRRMREHLVWVIILAVAGAAWAEATAPKELIVNGDFSKGTLGALPENWEVVCPNKVLSPTFALAETGEGERYLTASGNGRKACFGYIRQKLDLPKGKTFKMTVRFKVQGIEDVNRHLVHGIWGTFNNGIFEYRREGEWIVGENRFAGKGGACEVRFYFRFSPFGKVLWSQASLSECEAIGPRLVKVAVCQGNRDHKAWERFLDTAGEKGCDVALMTEFFAKGVQEMDGPTMQFMSAKAKQWKMYVSGSVQLKRGDTVYNSAPLYDRQGKLMGIYDKVMLYDPELDEGTSPGTDVPVFEADFGTLGIMICYDSWHPSVAKLLALKGAELVLFPSAGYYQQLMHARSADNGVVVAATSSFSPCGVWDASGNQADGASKDGTRHGPSQIVAYEEDKEQKMQIVTLDLSKEASPHYWGGPMRSAPGGRRVRTTSNYVLEDEIARQVRRWTEE